MSNGFGAGSCARPLLPSHRVLSPPPPGHHLQGGGQELFQRRRLSVEQTAHLLRMQSHRSQEPRPLLERSPAELPIARRLYAIHPVPSRQRRPRLRPLLFEQSRNRFSRGAAPYWNDVWVGECSCCIVSC